MCVGNYGPECGKIGTRKTPNTDTFPAVYLTVTAFLYNYFEKYFPKKLI